MDGTTAMLLDGGASVDESSEARIHHMAGESTPGAEDCVEPRNLCAYNKTRGYILGVEIACGDFSAVGLADQMPMLTPKSGAGLWMVPFRGIPTTDVRVPLDLIYLDPDCQVIETVEFFPTFRVSPSCPPAASVLVLPVHSVFASHTQAGDQVAFGLVEEVEDELARLFGSGASAGAVQDALGAREELVGGDAPAPQNGEDRAKEETAASQPVEAEETGKAEPWKKEISKPKSWLQRLLSPDPPEPRKAPRAALPGLTAYFWTGGTPQANAIRDISSTGLYVLTDERWYPGTLIQMTLKKTESGKVKAEYSITVLAKANRWGNDGVGLGFVIRDPRHPLGDGAHAGAVDREELDRFLARIGQGKG